MFVDLHMHTHYSDGSQSPESVVAVSKARGLSVISVCDHNTTAAYGELRPACQAQGLTLVQGVELDAAWQGRVLHLLAYGFDPHEPHLADLIQTNLSEQLKANADLIRVLSAQYPQLSEADYAAYQMPRGRGGWKSLNYLFDRGITTNLEDGFVLHAQAGVYRPAFGEIERLCAAVKAAGGVPVLAHPGNWWPEPDDGLLTALNDLAGQGVAGIECYYPSHSPALTAFCVDFCRRTGLRFTCGCDGHGTFCREIAGITYDIGLLKVDSGSLDLRGIV